MKKSKINQSKSSFFSNIWNVLLVLAITVTVGYLFYLYFYLGINPLSNVKRNFQKYTVGCGKPPVSEVEAHFKDNAGSKPVAPDFDADPGEICGNGKKYYCTSVPPKKAIPFSWSPPPLPGTDPSYKGPEPGAEFKESPYAMPSSKAILARPPIRDFGEPEFIPLLKSIVSKTSESEKVGYLSEKSFPAKLDFLSSKINKLSPAMFETEDDEAVAKSLLDSGVNLLLVDRTLPFVAPWVEEKMNILRIRLRDAVSIDWFHPVVLGSGYVLYKIAPPVKIPKYVKRRITTYIRNLLTGTTSDPIDVNLESPSLENIRIIVSLRWRDQKNLKGRKLVQVMSHDKMLIEAATKAVNKIRKNWGNIRKRNLRKYNFKVPADLPHAVSSMEIEVDVLYDLCIITDRNPRNLKWYVELGLEGISLRGKDTFFFKEPNYAVHLAVSSEVVLLERMLIKNKLNNFLREPKKKKIKRKREKVLSESQWMKDTVYKFGRFRSINWIERPRGGDIIELYRGVPLKTIWDVTRSSLVKSLELGALWLMENQAPDGSYAYKYTPTNKPGRRWTAGGNIVRHALNPYTLLMVNKIAPLEKYVKSAKKGIEFTLQFLRKEGNRCVICHRDPPARYYNAKIGTVAVTILSILKLGDVADISEYDEILRCLGEEIIYMQDPNGHYWQYDVPLNHPYYGAESFIAPGEFVFALARLYTHYKYERYKESIDRALKFYMSAWRKLLVERTESGVYDEEHRVNLIGIVPWLVTAMNDLHKATGDKRYADIGFEQQDWIDHEFFWYLERSQYPDYAGASYKVYSELPAINSCQYTEGAAAAYDIAKRTGKNVEKRRQVVVHGMRFCLQLQYQDYDTTFFLPVPKEAMGGYRYTLGHLRLRNDYSYHAMAAIAQAVEYLEPFDYPVVRPLRIPKSLDALLGGQEGPQKDVLKIPVAGDENSANETADGGSI